MHCNLVLNLIILIHVPYLNLMFKLMLMNQPFIMTSWDIFGILPKKKKLIRILTLRTLKNIMNKLNLGDIDIDIIASDINKIWQDTVACVLREWSTNLQRHERHGGNIKWFNQDCRVSGIYYLRNKDAFRRNKLCINKINLIRSS